MTGHPSSYPITAAALEESIRTAETMLSQYIEEFHDFDYEPHEVPLELQGLRNIQHHLLGSLIDLDGQPVDAQAGIPRLVRLSSPTDCMQEPPADDETICLELTGAELRDLVGARFNDPAQKPGRSDDLAELVDRFSKRLLAKLRLAQANGRSGWERDDWEKECQQGLLRHVAKGDPRDVAAYCAFMDHHGWITVPATDAEQMLAALLDIRQIANSAGNTRFMIAKIFDIATQGSRGEYRERANPSTASNGDTQSSPQPTYYCETCHGDGKYDRRMCGLPPEADDTCVDCKGTGIAPPAKADVAAHGMPGARDRGSWMPSTSIKPRRPFENKRPYGMLESDLDYLENNREVAVELLEHYSALLSTDRVRP